MLEKIINVSDKRQITIPVDFYRHLNIKDKVSCTLEDGAIVIKPYHQDTTEFSVEILKDLIEEGYEGDDLVTMFEKRNKDIKGAIVNLLEEADKIAAGEVKGSSFEDVFGEEL